MCICDIIYKEIGFTQKDVFALCVVAPSSERKRGEGEREREREIERESGRERERGRARVLGG